VAANQLYDVDVYVNMVEHNDFFEPEFSKRPGELGGYQRRFSHRVAKIN